MSNPSWLFVIAAYIAVIGIFIAYKQLLATIEERINDNEIVTQGNFQKEMSRFFIKVPLIEIVPILLIIFGFIQLEDVQGTGQLSDIIIPFGFVLIVLVFGITNVLLLRARLVSIKDIDNQSKPFINALSFIGISLLAAIPIVSFVAMYVFI
ncbi:hypothetical protein RJD24_07960 [Bacillaceae bacterium IKA-2]|nr:hypothetical protein RJD24_07960 [Bacillaceae bacterium IKA-2]